MKIEVGKKYLLEPTEQNKDSQLAVEVMYYDQIRQFFVARLINLSLGIPHDSNFYYYEADGECVGPQNKKYSVNSEYMGTYHNYYVVIVHYFKDSQKKEWVTYCDHLEKCENALRSVLKSVKGDDVSIDDYHIIYHEQIVCDGALEYHYTSLVQLEAYLGRSVQIDEFDDYQMNVKFIETLNKINKEE